MTPQESTLLKEFKKIWPNLAWPESFESFDKKDYPEFFIKDLKQVYKSLEEKGNDLTFFESALCVFWRRLETNFKPEIITKKTKVKTPKLGALEAVECSCGNETGIWKEVNAFPLTIEVKLFCTKCDSELSESVQILVKAKKVSESKEPKVKAISDKPAKVKKPSKKDLAEFDSLVILMEKYKTSIEELGEESQELYYRVKTWKEGEKNETE